MNRIIVNGLFTFAPHEGHTFALLLTCEPHSLHLINATGSPSTSIRISVYANKSIALKVRGVPTRPTLSQRFGACVRELRTEQGLSQTEFGERCGFYQTYLSRIENGRANPTLNAMEVIANALGMTIFEVFELLRTQNLKRSTKDRTQGR